MEEDPEPRRECAMGASIACTRGPPSDGASCRERGGWSGCVKLNDCHAVAEMLCGGCGRVGTGGGKQTVQRQNHRFVVLQHLGHHRNVFATLFPFIVSRGPFRPTPASFQSIVFEVPEFPSSQRFSIKKGGLESFAWRVKEGSWLYISCFTSP